MSLEEKIEQLMELQIGNLIDKAIEHEETHVGKVIFHLTPDTIINGSPVDISVFEEKLGFDDYGISADTGEPRGNLIEMNDDGDYVLYDVEIGNHEVGLTYNGSILPFDYRDIYGNQGHPASEHGSEVYIDNTHKEFTIIGYEEPQVTTQ